jgi:two-component system, sensor histidine kinase and response regulator
MPHDESAPAAILMVDDHPPNLIALTAVLEPLGHELVSAQSGAEAVELAANRDFALIVMDVQMPLLDGFQTAGIIKQYEATRYVPIIFLTAMDREGAQMFRAYQSGAVDYLVKPFDPAVLRSKVSVFVELYQQRRKIQDQQQLLHEERLARVGAEAAARAREEILSIVSHELGNPVMAVGTYASLLLRHAELAEDATVRKYATRQADAARKMERLLGDLLDTVRAERGALAIAKKPYPVSEVVDQLMAVMLPVAQRKFQTLTIDMPPAPCTLCCDRDRIFQVLANLVGNAIKFTPKHGSIRVVVEVRGGEVIFSVKDTGPGILPDEVPHIFDRYWKASPTKQGGLGLGLAIAKDIVQAHAGRIWVEGQPGDGSTFYAAFPQSA